jgi:soluble lytic murein transglycosylase-like protein
MTASAHAAERFDASCWTHAATRYRLDPVELAAHACVESRLRTDAKHVNTDGSVDFTVMQINSRHVTRLAHYGITRNAMERDACLSIYVGAYLLADLKTRYGDTWEATGAYNAGCTTLKGAACRKVRAKYAWRVYHAMNHLRASGHC